MEATGVPCPSNQRRLSLFPPLSPLLAHRASGCARCSATRAGICPTRIKQLVALKLERFLLFHELFLRHAAPALLDAHGHPHLVDLRHLLLGVVGYELVDDLIDAGDVEDRGEQAVLLMAEDR